MPAPALLLAPLEPAGGLVTVTGRPMTRAQFTGNGAVHCCRPCWPTVRRWTRGRSSVKRRARPADGTGAVLDLAELAAVTGWAQKPEGWCRGTECIPASFIGDAATATSLSVAGVAAALGAPFAIDTQHRLAVIGTAADGVDAGRGSPRTSICSDSTATATGSSTSPGKTLVVAFASWCGCRYDLPGWKEIKDELAGTPSTSSPSPSTSRRRSPPGPNRWTSPCSSTPTAPSRTPTG